MAKRIKRLREKRGDTSGSKRMTRGEVRSFAFLREDFSEVAVKGETGPLRAGIA